MSFFKSLILVISIGVNFIYSPFIIASEDYSTFDINEAFKDVHYDGYEIDWNIEEWGNEEDRPIFLKIENDHGDEASFSARDLNRLKVMIDSYNSFISDSDDDKSKHVSAGRLGGLFMKSVCDHSGLAVGNLSQKQTSFLCSLGAATTAGILKEVYDSSGRGNVEFGDAAATSLGGVFFEFKF